jgi:predicted acylesterase/phospholipase RssA
MTFSLRILTALAPLLLAAGCTTSRPYPPPSLPATARLVEIRPGPDGGSPVRQAAAIDTEESARHAPRDVLVLSGGGMVGAYTVGVLKGWSASGRRPRFDVVTGVSTGALIAPFAFLGPDYDDLLERGYTGVRPGDLYRLRYPTSLLWSDSLADAEPLRRRVEAEITPELVARVAREHASGRRLYVGTTNLDTKSLVVWDLGAIAAGDDPHKVGLIREVLLASCAVPGLLPPVPITVGVNNRPRSELHVDGGVNVSLFLPPSVLGLRRCEDGPAAATGTTVHAIVAGKLRPEGRPVERRFLRVSGESLAAMLQARLEGDLLKVYVQSRHAGAAFRLTGVPEEVPLDANWMGLDGPALRRLFDAGYEVGAGGTAWRTEPPGLRPEDQPTPRGGVRFVIEE